MKRLYVLYDAKCPLCVGCRNWLKAQSAFVNLTFIPLQTPMLEQFFPGLAAVKQGDQLVVISDEGAVYLGSDAWIICLYALRDYREWSQRLAHPALRPFARAAFKKLSENRLAISRWFGAAEMEELRRDLASEAEGVCHGGACQSEGGSRRAIARARV